MKAVGPEYQRLMKAKKYDQRWEEIMRNVMQDPEVQQFLTKHKSELSQEEIERSASKLYEFVQEKKKFNKAASEVIAPGYEPKLVINHHYIDVSYVPTEELLAARRAAEIKNHIQASTMARDVREASFADFDSAKHSSRSRNQAAAKLIEFSAAYLENPKSFHKGLYLYGSFGVGKSYLLGALAHELAVNGVASMLVHFPTFAQEMKESIGEKTTKQKLKAAKEAPVLMIDDIGADSQSAWIRDEVLAIILQYRMQEKLPTFFTSNKEMKQLQSEYLLTSRNGEEPVKAMRIMERIRYLADEMHIEGPDRRNGHFDDEA
ncbi:primosomal protein DnaI [Enterococcus hirae]|nr:primosomal protein DnaI [Enterococcus hirae]